MSDPEADKSLPENYFEIESLIESGVQELGLNETVKTRSIEEMSPFIYEASEQIEAASIAAAAVYVAILFENANRSQPDVAEAFDVSTATIRKYYHEMLECNPDVTI